MKILCFTPWKNTWISYWTQYIESRGHEVDWYIKEKIYEGELKKVIQNYDKLLTHWADKYAIILSDPEINTKPLYVIIRSYEIFSAEGWSDLGVINWKNVKKTFMLNEAHYHPFSCRVQGVKPVFIKNGVDLEEWQLNDITRCRDKIAWICDVNEKKGVELVVQAISELTKINPDITLEHIGRNQDIRRWYYLEQVMPHLNTKWYNVGFKNDHNFVKDFLADKKFIISTSIAEGNPMNIIEAMATGVIPLVHNWPGAEIQFPKECIWTTFDQLRDIYQKLDQDTGTYARMRKWAEKHYDYRINYKPVIDAMEAE